MLLEKHQVPDSECPCPKDRSEGNEPVVVCLKGCWSKYAQQKKKEKKEMEKAVREAEKEAQKKFKKVSWEEEGSLQILVGWLTTEPNYSYYCGGIGNKGQSKSQYHKDIAMLIRNRIPGGKRTDKDVENKICHLERQFCIATD